MPRGHAIDFKQQSENLGEGGLLMKDKDKGRA